VPRNVTTPATTASTIRTISFAASTGTG
jgi:hypothetical protein